MRAFHFVIHTLAQIVQQARALGSLYVSPQLRGHHARQLRHLNGVAQHILAVAGTVMQAAQHFHQLRVQPAHAGFKGGALAFGFDNGIHFTFGFLHHFLNAGGVDTSVGYELFKRYTRDLAAYGIKA